MYIRNILKDHIKRYYGSSCNMPPELVARVGLGKKIRPGLISSIVGRNDDRTQLCAAAMETLHAGFLIADDACDNARQRNGQLAWHRIHGVANAWNDANFLVSTSVLMFADCFRGSKSDVAMGFVTQAIAVSCMGQRSDMNVNLANIWSSDIMKTYERMCYQKTGKYTIGLPVQVANLLIDRDPTEVKHHIDAVSLHLGCIFQSCNDIRSPTNEDTEQQRLTWMAAVVARHNPSLETLSLAPEALVKEYENHDLANMHKFYCERKSNTVNRHLDQLRDAGFIEVSNAVEPFTREWT
jgi:geranylgeranyl pyrophosphate synthase